MARARPKSLSDDYFPALTGLRALAALLVFFHHYFGHWTEIQGAVIPFVREGYIGVSVFFTLSAFLITKTYFHRFATGRMDFWKYWFRRFARVFPLYWFLLAVTYALLPERAKDPIQILSNLTVTQAFFSEHLWSGIYSAWSLTIEECFYLIAPLCFLVIARFSQVRKGSRAVRGQDSFKVFLILFGISAALWILGMGVIRLYIPGSLLADPLNFDVYLIFSRFPEFAIGVFGALIFERRKGLNRFYGDVVFGLSFISIFACLACLAWLKVKYVQKFGIYSREAVLVNLAVGISTLGIAWSAIQTSPLCQAILGNRFFEYLGKISFATYLVQATPLFGQLWPKWNALFGAPQTNFTLSLLLLLVLSAILYELIERPAHAWLLNRLERSKQR